MTDRRAGPAQGLLVGSLVVVLCGLAAPARAQFIPYYGKYIDLVPAGNLASILATQGGATRSLLAPLDEARALHRYGPGKWSIKEVIGHIADAERVFAYRALRFARAPVAQRKSIGLLSRRSQVRILPGASVSELEPDLYRVDCVRARHPYAG